MKFNRKKYMENYNKKYYQKHKEECKQRQSKYSQTKKGQLTSKKYYQENIKKIKAYKKQKHINCMGVMHNLKINGCAICGYDKCEDALDFHHTNPEDKLFSVNSTNVYRKIELFVAELNKCILLCNRCHKEIHTKEKELM